MGMDIYGKAPKNTKGGYFRNNWWWWRPLWTLVTHFCDDILTNEDIRGGSEPGGHNISAEKAAKLVERLNEKLKDGSVKEFAADLTKERKAAEAHNKKLKLTPGDKDYRWAEAYPINMKNVRDFVSFMKNSGGFSFH